LSIVYRQKIGKNKNYVREGDDLLISAAIPVTTDYGGDGFAFNSAKYGNQESK
jgi:hypothetical protein